MTHMAHDVWRHRAGLGKARFNAAVTLYLGDCREILPHAGHGEAQVIAAISLDQPRWIMRKEQAWGGMEIIRGES
jgi:hypothetical protein